MMKREPNRARHYLLKYLILSLLTLPVILSACARQESIPVVVAHPEVQSSYVVSRVIDGDTIVLEDRTRVRYIGIDTSETKHPRKPVQYFGKEASEANKKLVEGKKVRLEYDVQKTDKYGRTLAYVYLKDGTFVNAWLVENGYAQVSTYPPNVKYQEKFLELERKAREEQKGLWGK
jgi:micrococcal nuclease